MDLFSQAEHDELAQAILLSPDAALLDAVAKSAQRQIVAMPRRAIIAASFANRGALVRVRDLDEACAVANRIAPEHLELAVADPAALVPKIRHAGAIFMGHHASEALGDYCAGPNHVLPTGRTARFSSPLGVYDFQKRTSLLGVPALRGARAGAGRGHPRRRRGPAGARAKRPVSRERPMNDRLPATTDTMRSAAEIAAAVVRPEIRALTAYAVAKADRTRQARRQRESVPAARVSARQDRRRRRRGCRSTATPMPAPPP